MSIEAPEPAAPATRTSTPAPVRSDPGQASPGQPQLRGQPELGGEPEGRGQPEPEETQGPAHDGRAESTDATEPEAGARDPGSAEQAGQNAASRRRRGRVVTLVIPAKDEAAAIGHTLRSLPIKALQTMGLRAEVVVLDGNSRDGTPEIARRHGAIVLQDPGSGKGRALREARRFIKGDFVVMLDADGSYAPDAIPRVLDLLLRNEADIVMGDRQPRPGAMSGLHKVGNVFLSLQASVIYGRPCKDVCTGLWGFRAEALRMLPLRAHGFELEAELFALASRLRMRIAHVDVDYLPRTGETKLSAGRDGLRIGWCLIESRFRRLTPPTP